jgi:hypothetical protein
LGRYSREHAPVLGAALSGAGASPEAAASAAPCARCGAALLCELQLVPAFAAALRVAPTNAPLSHLHFLSVLVFTCSLSCWQTSDTLVTETVLFQPEV